MSIFENYTNILKEVKKYNPEAELLAVSKNQELWKMEELALNNVKLFGESKVQEALPKIDYLTNKFNDLEFHFIGKVQSNKLKKIVENFALIHSVDNIEYLEKIDRYAKEYNKKQRILIQINIAEEPQKNGISICEIDSFINQAISYSNILLEGIMFMPPYEEIVEKNIPYFQEAQRIFNEYSKKVNTFKYLSMGMSHDFQTALEYGANIVRVGTNIFGAR